jgi:hypothetical protein
MEELEWYKDPYVESRTSLHSASEFPDPNGLNGL